MRLNPRVSEDHVAPDSSNYLEKDVFPLLTFCLRAIRLSLLFIPPC